MSTPGWLISGLMYPGTWPRGDRWKHANQQAGLTDAVATADRIRNTFSLSGKTVLIGEAD